MTDLLFTVLQTHVAHRHYTQTLPLMMVHLAQSILIQEVTWPSAYHIVKYSTTADIKTTWTEWGSGYTNEQVHNT